MMPAPRLDTAWDRATLDLERACVRVCAAQSDALASLPETLRAGAPVPAAIGMLEASVRSRLEEYGFALCRDWPTAADDVRTGDEFAGFCSLFGVLRAQDGLDERWRFVQDRALITGVPGTSGSTGTMNIDLHTENARPPHPPRLIALLCIRPAVLGGQSLLASGPAVRERIARDRPEHLPALERPIPFGRRREDWSDGIEYDEQPVFSPGAPFTLRYSRYWTDLAVEQSELSLPPETAAAIDAVDELLAGTDIPVEFALAAGDALIVDNHVVMHGRREFEDDPAARRRLARVWMD